MNSHRTHIVFRCDGNAQIGLGHVYRCLALAQIIKDHYLISFFSKTLPESLFTKIRSLGFSANLIDDETDFLDCLRGSELIILDNYQLDSFYQVTIKNKGCKLICIDDLHDKEFYADLIINPAIGIDSSHYKCQPYTKFALGIEYALLRPPFLKAATNVRQIEKVETVFICFGGSDPMNLTIRTLKLVLNSKKIRRVFVVVGAAFKNLNEIDSLIDNPVVECFQNIDDDQMVSLMTTSDLAIVPASGILIEILACGVIPITCFYAKNQSDFHESITSFCDINTIGPVDTEFEIRLKEELDLNLMSLNHGRNIQKILAQSAERIREVIKSVLL